MFIRSFLSSPRVSTVTRAALGAIALLASAGLSAEAQYYPYQPAPRYHPAPQYRAQPYPYPQHYDDYRPRPRYRQQPMGMVCVTSRGECSTGRPVPLGTGCKCMIRNFGQKRGHVQY